MQDPQAYYAGIREEKARLDKLYPSGFVFIMSVQNLNCGSTGGAVTEVPTRIAAKHIVDVTARIATDEDIAEFKRKGKHFSDEMTRQELNRDKAAKAQKEQAENQTAMVDRLLKELMASKKDK